MNVVYFLKERTKFIRRFYENAGEPFRVTIKKIEAKEAPFNTPPYGEGQDGEPPFMEEWSEANTSLEIVGRTCISMLSASLQLYFTTWEGELGIKCESEERKKAFENGFLRGYQICFGDVLHLSWDDCPVDFGLLEQVILARHRDQHPEYISTMHVNHTLKDWKKFPQPFFASESEQRMCADPDILGNPFMRPIVHVSSESLTTAIDQVEALAGWLEERLFAAKYRSGG